MILHDSGIDGKVIDMRDVDNVLEDLGFIRWGWDYDYATYDYKYEIVDSCPEAKAKNDIYYLRITGDAVEGNVLHGRAVLRLWDPYVGKATFPHGVDYDAEVPPFIMNKIKQKVQEASQKLTTLPEVKVAAPK